MLFNDRWSFCKTERTEENLLRFPAPDQYRKIDLPHDWAIYKTEDFYRTTIGWYRAELPRAQKPHAFLCFDGVYMDSTLFVNGEQAGEWKYGYTAHQYDIGALLTRDVNEVIVRVDFRSPNSRWYSGAGIYRDVEYIEKDAAYLPLNGAYLHAEKAENGWDVTARVEAVGGDQVKLELAGASCLMPVKDGIAAGTLHVDAPRVWDLQDPYTYTARVTLLQGEAVMDEAETAFGFRQIRFDCDHGFFLNEKHVKLHGVCLHHDLGAVGSAFNKAAARRQLLLMKRMGVNALRTSHNPPAKQMMDLCDELGILVNSEAFDMWGLQKTAYDYARFFNEWVEKDVAGWVRRDRNHPSVILWSMGNEIYDTHAGEIGMNEMLRIREAVWAHDPLHNAFATIGSNYIPWENTQKCADVLKLIGYNYAERLYDEHHAAHPDWMIYGSETASIVQSRGIYHFPASENILADDDLQCSSLNNSTTSWGAKTISGCITQDRDTEHCAGQFLWTGTDYLGEPTPYHTKNSYFGLADTAGYEKDIYYIFKAGWDEDPAPFLHLWPYWDFNEGQLIDIFTTTNQPVVILTLNGKEVGRREMDCKHGAEMYVHFRLPYEKGVLEAKALDAAGHVTCTACCRSFGDAAALCAEADKTALKADGRDMIFVTITARDKDGNPVENAVNRVQVRVEGAARLAGLDAGDSTDMDSFKQDNRRMFSGKLLAMLMSNGKEGDIRVTVTSPGLESAVLELQSLPCPACEKQGVGVYETIPESAPVTEIPVRKIELSFPDGTRMNAENKNIRVRAKILPENATYRDLHWRMVNDAGIDCPLAVIKTDGCEGIITGRFDGDLRIRCLADNGQDHACVISQMELHCEGLGDARLDPYSFLSCGLHDMDNGMSSAGNERGIATANTAESMFGFSAIDFGDYGSDELTIPIFTLNGERYDFEIWDGDPYNGGELVCNAVYQKPSIWNVYQEETYTLTRRLKGIRTLCFVTHDKMHMKGFTFKRYDRAFSPLDLTDALSVYGDDFTRDGTVLRDIGNNVAIDLGELDFGDAEALSVTLRGYSPIPVNTIHVRFKDENGMDARAVEFTHEDDVSEKSFPMPGITGKKHVELVFLPGSKFDLHSVRFSHS